MAQIKKLVNSKELDDRAKIRLLILSWMTKRRIF